MRFLLLALLLPAFAHAELTQLERESGVLRVSSEYEPGRPQTGTGILVFRKGRAPGEKDRTFLFTCAHLTGGQDARVGGIPLAQVAIGRRTDNFRDLDLVEIDPKKLPARAFARHAPISEQSLSYYRSTLVPRYAKEYGLSEEETLSTIHNVTFWIDDKSLAKWRAQSNGTLEVANNQAQPPFVLMPPWSAREQAEKFTKKRWGQMIFANVDARTNGVSMVNITNTVTAPARIAPGMSCAPLVSSYHVGGKTYKYQVAGLGTEFRTQMASSTFSTSGLWSEALDAYLKGDVKEDVPAQWAAHDGLLYLRIGEKSAEIIPAKPAGNGVTVDPGNGVTVDPGKSGQAGKPAACDARAFDPLTPWEKTGTRPGILWEGKETMAFSMEFAPGARVLIFPDRAGIEFRLANEDAARQVESVPPGTPVLGWLNDRYGTQSQQYRLSHGDMYVPIKRAEVARHGDQLDLTLYSPAPESERIQFSLNEYGALTTATGDRAKELNPLVEVKGEQGNVYIVDLTDLFFVQAKSLGGFLDPEIVFNKALAKAHPETVLKKKRESLAWKLGGGHLTRGMVPGLSFRKKCSDDEIRLNFKGIQQIVEAENVCYPMHLPNPIPRPFLNDARYLYEWLSDPENQKNSR